MSFTRNFIRDRDAWLLRGFLLVTSLLSTAAVVQFRGAVIASGFAEISAKWRLGASLLFILPGVFWLLTVLSLTRLSIRSLKMLAAAGRILARFGRANWILFLGSLLAFCYIMIWPVPSLTAGFFTRAFFFWLFSLAGFIFLRFLFPGLQWKFLALVSALVYMTSFRIAWYLPGITNYPFSLSWSEANVYFYSSLFFSSKIYGVPTPLPFYFPARALLGIVPFLMPNPQIWIARLWTAFLWIACTGLATFTVARRLRLRNRFFVFLFILWAFLFFLQGPIYYELILTVALVAWLFDSHHFGRSLLVVLATSAWAGMCRVNWYPVPGAFAGLLYLLETPMEGKRLLTYLLKPLTWMVAGLATALGVSVIYGALAGSPTTFTNVALQSRLLWYRLLPNPTSPLGVLPEAALISLPALLVIGIWQARQGQGFAIWRRLGVLAILLVFFAGGLVVSAKIGGGANIHNLDAYWFLLLVVASYLYFGRMPADTPTGGRPLHIPAWLTVALIATPLLFALTVTPYNPPPGPGSVNEVLAEMQNYVSTAAQKGEQVLFIDNKQLLAFGLFSTRPVETQYETWYMLDMAMSENESFFQNFYQDLKTHRFGVIIAYPQPKLLQDQNVPLSEENNAQLTWIGYPLLCYYQEAYIRLDVNVEVFTPKAQTQGCP